jgi:hypothetical protein
MADGSLFFNLTVAVVGGLVVLGGQRYMHRVGSAEAWKTLRREKLEEMTKLLVQHCCGHVANDAPVLVDGSHLEDGKGCVHGLSQRRII